MKITKAIENKPGNCIRCKSLGRWSLNWIAFMYKIEGKDGLYCWECARKIKEEENEKNKTNMEKL